MDIRIGDLDENLRRITERLETAVANGASLVVYPECALSGYCFDTLEEAHRSSVALDDRPISEIINACRRVDAWAIIGFLERDGERVFNSLALLSPDGVAASYRKVHLPFLGVDRFSTAGSRPFEVHDVGAIRVGMNICYDCSFPEPSRVLALAGADLIALPTNWPPGAGLTADVIPNARALENNVYFMSVNRVGTERGFEFIGKSKVCDPDGHDLAFANHANEEIIYADINPAKARNKHLVRVPNKHEIHRFDDRRPELYQPLVAKQADSAKRSATS